jgi:hypothetical protein
VRLSLRATPAQQQWRSARTVSYSPQPMARSGCGTSPPISRSARPPLPAPGVSLTTIALEAGDELFLGLMSPDGSVEFTHVPGGEWTLHELGQPSAKSYGALLIALPPSRPLATLAAASRARTALIKITLPRAEAVLVLHREDADAFLLEVIPDTVDGSVRFVSVHYGDTDGYERVLIIPFLGAGLARLHGYAASLPWEASLPGPADQLLAWDLETVAASVHAAVNNATRRAWKTISDRVPGLRDAITEELSRLS